jgi:hypothetical protein
MRVDLLPSPTVVWLRCVLSTSAALLLEETSRRAGDGHVRARGADGDDDRCRGGRAHADGSHTHSGRRDRRTRRQRVDECPGGARRRWCRTRCGVGALPLGCARGSPVGLLDECAAPMQQTPRRCGIGEESAPHRRQRDRTLQQCHEERIEARVYGGALRGRCTVLDASVWSVAHLPSVYIRCAHSPARRSADAAHSRSRSGVRGGRELVATTSRRTPNDHSTRTARNENQTRTAEMIQSRDAISIVRMVWMQCSEFEFDRARSVGVDRAPTEAARPRASTLPHQACHSPSEQKVSRARGTSRRNRESRSRRERSAAVGHPPAARVRSSMHTLTCVLFRCLICIVCVVCLMRSW